jgi:hypothetical protein
VPWIEVPIWHGTLEESYDLAKALEHHCECQTLKRRCPAHCAMLEQRFIDGLLFVRHLRARLSGEEFACNSEQLEAWRSLLDG